MKTKIYKKDNQYFEKIGEDHRGLTVMLNVPEKARKSPYRAAHCVPNDKLSGYRPVTDKVVVQGVVRDRAALQELFNLLKERGFGDEK